MVHVLEGVFTAKDFFDRLMGLMGRGRWPSGHRGIFFPHCRSIHTLFTFLKPDLVFIDSEYKILKIFPLAAPWLVFHGPKGSAHCLELPAGFIRSHRLKEGDTVRFTN
jgi:uncharacterized membrane protein (UPF0127 family)